MKPNVFTCLHTHINATTDSTLTYIPTLTREIKSKKMGIISYSEPNKSNNYADLIIINNSTSFGFKAVRVKSLDGINFDGSHITWDNSCNNNDNFLVFYSIRPNEVGKILIISIKAYSTFVLKYNNICPTIDINNLNKIKEQLGFSDKDIKIMDYQQHIELNEVEEKNIIAKYKSCNNTLNFLNKNPFSFIKTRTHFGNQYIAYNFLNGQKIIFRDANARNEFFAKNTNIKLANNNVINRNCHNQTKFVNDEDLDKLQMNIYENEGWIILDYSDTLMNHEDFKEYILTLFHKLCAFSKAWNKRLSHLLNKIDEIMEKITNLIIKIKNKIKEKICYFRPLKLYEYVSCTFETTLEKLFHENPYLLKYYIKNKVIN
jgi:hypothetical protein